MKSFDFIFEVEFVHVLDLGFLADLDVLLDFFEVVLAVGFENFACGAFEFSDDDLLRDYFVDDVPN